MESCPANQDARRLTPDILQKPRLIISYIIYTDLGDCDRAQYDSLVTDTDEDRVVIFAARLPRRKSGNGVSQCVA